MRTYLGVFIMAASLSSGKSPNQHLIYPKAKKVNVADDYHGTKVPDAYRWLEDTNAPDTAEWVAAENKITEDYLKGIPQRARLLKRLTQLADFERYTNAFQYGGRYFVFHNNGLQNQDVLFTMDSVNGKERVLLDPNVLRADGTAALSGLSISEDGKLVAYAIAQAGSDWSEWRVRSVETGNDLPDLIQWTKFSNAAWTPDNQGFFYQRFPEPSKDKLLTDETLFGQIYYHHLGDAQSKDKLIYERPDKRSWFFQPTVSEDGCYLILTVNALDFGRNMLYYQDLKDPNGKMVELIDKLTAPYEYLGNKGTPSYFPTP